MKIQDIKNCIKNVQTGFYVLTGDEEYLKSLFLKYIKKEYDDYNITIFAENTTIDEIQKVCDQSPFFAQSRLVIVSVQIDESRLNEYIKNLPETTCLIYEISPIDKRKSLFKDAAKNKSIFEFNKLSFYETMDWITSYAESKGYKMDREASAAITDYSISLRDAVNKVDMLISYVFPDTKLSKHNVVSLFGAKIEDNIFKFIDMIEENSNESFRILENIISGGSNVQYILSMLLRHYRLLIKTKLLLNKNLNVEKNLGVKPYECKKFKEIASKYSLETFIKSHKRCLEVDKRIKSGLAKSDVPLDLLVVNLMNKN